MIQMHLNGTDRVIVDKIVARAKELTDRLKIKNFNPISCDMDLCACHLNGCPLDLPKLLESRDQDFAHDIFGIANNMDRTTGKLLNNFDPRCSLPEEEGITEYLNPGECIEEGKHLTSCDDDGFCNHCGEQ